MPKELYLWTLKYKEINISVKEERHIGKILEGITMMIRVIMNMSGVSFFLFSKPLVMKLYKFIIKLS